MGLLINLLTAAGRMLNACLLYLVTIVLLHICNFFLPANFERTFNYPETYQGIILYVVLIYIFYLLVFGLVLRRYELKPPIKGLITGTLAMGIVYILSNSFGGEGRWENLQYTSWLIIMFIIGFLLPVVEYVLIKIMATIGINRAG